MKSTASWTIFLSTIVCVALIASLVVVSVPSAQQGRRECALRATENGHVCVCNSSYCDTLDPLLDSYPDGTVVVFTTSESGLRFQETSLLLQTSSQVGGAATIKVNASVRYQWMKGFGGAFTDASGINIESLPPKARDKLLRSYYSAEGLEYNVGRIPMAGCDFSIRGYTYNDIVGDLAMVNFSLAHEDFTYKIPYIKHAMSMNSRKMSFYGSPWSAPAWMKTNNELFGRGSLKGEPGGEYFHAWGLYFARFIEEYANNGIDIWGVTAQNEPSAGQIENFPFNCMGFTDVQQRDFIKFDLGPILHERGHEDVKVMILDDQRLSLPEWPKVVLADPVVDNYVSGIAVHWYTDFFVPPKRLSDTHDLFPDKFIIGSEACAGYIPIFQKGVMLGSWVRGERYSDDIIDDVTNWVTGWVDWNIALDMGGGPNWKTNFVDSPIIVNKDAGEFYKQPMYYHMGHFSKFVPEGSYRIQSTSEGLPVNVKHVAFISPDNDRLTLVVLNKSDRELKLTVEDPNQGVVDDILQAKSIKTYTWSNFSN